MASQPQVRANVDSFPTLPMAALRLAQMIADPKTSAADLAAVLKQDVALTAKTLRLVNSPYYAVPGGVADVQKALSYLGFNTVAQLVLGASVVSAFKQREVAGFSVHSLWKHSFGVATLCESLARKLKFGRPEAHFTLGLLHDLGKFAMIETQEPAFRAIIQRASGAKISFCEAERAAGGPEHAAVGAELAAHWNLPKEVVGVIAHHHAADWSKIPEALRQPTALVQFCDAWVRAKNFGHSGSFEDCRDPQTIPDPLGCRSHMASLDAELARAEVLIHAAF